MSHIAYYDCLVSLPGRRVKYLIMRTATVHQDTSNDWSYFTHAVGRVGVNPSAFFLTKFRTVRLKTKLLRELNYDLLYYFYPISCKHRVIHRAHVVCSWNSTGSRPWSRFVSVMASTSCVPEWVLHGHFIRPLHGKYNPFITTPSFLGRLSPYYIFLISARFF